MKAARSTALGYCLIDKINSIKRGDDFDKLILELSSVSAAVRTRSLAGWLTRLLTAGVASDARRCQSLLYCSTWQRQWTNGDVTVSAPATPTKPTHLDACLSAACVVVTLMRCYVAPSNGAWPQWYCIIAIAITIQHQQYLLCRYDFITSAKWKFSDSSVRL